MKTIEVCDRAAALIEMCRTESGAMMYKSMICDLMCSIIDRADENGTIADDMPLLVQLSSLAELYGELANESD